MFNLVQDDKNIPLQFNPRFDAKVLALNSMKAGNWQKEERPSGYMHLPMEQKIMKVRIYDYDTYFEIYINDKFFYKFNYTGLICHAMQ